MEEMLTCDKCKSRNIYYRFCESHEGVAKEYYCVCGWSKPVLISLIGMTPAPPATAEQWRPDMVPGMAGGLATKGLSKGIRKGKPSKTWARGEDTPAQERLLERHPKKVKKPASWVGFWGA